MTLNVHGEQAGSRLSSPSSTHYNVQYSYFKPSAAAGMQLLLLRWETLKENDNEKITTYGPFADTSYGFYRVLLEETRTHHEIDNC